MARPPFKSRTTPDPVTGHVTPEETRVPQAAPALPIPPPLSDEYVPPAQLATELKPQFGVKPYPGFVIDWIWNGDRWRQDAQKAGKTLFTADQGYVLNPEDYEQDKDGHLLCQGHIAYVHTEAHAKAIAEAPRKELAARMGGYRHMDRPAGVGDEDVDPVIERMDVTRRGSERAMEEFKGYQTPNLAAPGVPTEH